MPDAYTPPPYTGGPDSGNIFANLFNSLYNIIQHSTGKAVGDPTAHATDNAALHSHINTAQSAMFPSEQGQQQPSALQQSFQKVFGGIFGTPGGQPGTAAAGGGYYSSSPTGSYYVGGSPAPGESGKIYPTQQAATAAGDVGAGPGGAAGGGGLAGMAGGALKGIGGALGSLFSNIFGGGGKAQFTPPSTTPAPKATFTAPDLSQTNVGGVKPTAARYVEPAGAQAYYQGATAPGAASPAILRPTVGTVLPGAVTAPTYSTAPVMAYTGYNYPNQQYGYYPMGANYGNYMRLA